MGDGGFADPAQGQAADGDAELHGVQDLIQLLMELLDGARTNTMRGDHLVQPGLAHAHQGEFGGHEERVCRDEQDDRYDPQHNEGNHSTKILSSRRFRTARIGYGNLSSYSGLTGFGF